MASQSLYRKWRSQTFGDLVGQEPIIITLKNALKSGNLRHAYLFTGPRGTGKTSTARLLAKTINCTNPQNDEPCNTCLQCREITAGSSFNVLEIDAASNRGIDSIRELREKVMMPPTTGKYKVYILDEVHMLTVEAFNALLKTLEEPPEHAIFVMATTDVHKLLPTVLSRCQRFDFKRITTREIIKHLQYIAEQEKVTLEGGAAELIARAAAGGMRDALSLLDQAIAYAGNTISLTQVQAMLGVADPRAIQKCISFVATLDSPSALHLIHELAEAGADLRQINVQIAEYWRAMMLAKAGANIAEILDCTDDERAEIIQVAKQFSLGELIECARIFAQNDFMQKSQGTPQLGLELAVLACIEVHRNGGEQGQMAIPPGPSPRPAPTQQGPTQPTAPRSSTTSNNRPSVPPQQAPSVAQSPAAVEPEIIVPTPPPVAQVDITINNTVVPAAPEAETPVTEVIQEVTVNITPPTFSVEDVKEKWEYVRRRVRTRKDGAKVMALLGGYNVVAVEGTSELPVVVIKATAEFHYKSLQKEEYSEAIRWAMKVELGAECDVRMLSPTASTPIRTTMSNRLAPPATLQAPAHREPPVAPVSLPVPAPQSQVKETKPVPSTPPPTAVPQKSQPPTPLARSNVVRENSKVASNDGETRQQTIEKHAKSDPVVKEVIRLFKAEIKDIQPK